MRVYPGVLLVAEATLRVCEVMSWMRKGHPFIGNTHEQKLEQRRIEDWRELLFPSHFFACYLVEK